MFNRRKLKKGKEENQNLQNNNKKLDGQGAELEDKLIAHKRKIEKDREDTWKAIRAVKTAIALCADPEYDEWDNHPAAMILVQQTRAYCDMMMFRGIENVPSPYQAKEETTHERQEGELKDWEKNALISQQLRETRAWGKIYGKDCGQDTRQLNRMLMPPMQAEDLDSRDLEQLGFTRFSRKEYESMVEATTVPEAERIAIEPGIDAIYTEPWNYIRLRNDERGLKRVPADQWTAGENMDFWFYWPFCITIVGNAGNHSATVASLYHKPLLLAVGETEMHATTYTDYRKSELFHRIDSNGTYWLKDGKPYCMVDDKQKAIIWAILHAIMESKGPVRYKGVSLNGNE